MTPQYTAREGYEPRAQVSPSSIKLARMCERAWGYRYILGLKEPEAAWSEFLPGAPRAKRPTDREELKAWNRLWRPALGKAVHSCLEDWYAERPVDWHSEPGKILLPALMYFPHPKQLDSWVTEEKLPEWFVSSYTEGRHNYEFNAYIDLNGLQFGEHSKLHCNDAKSTSSFDWAAKPAELLEDTQGIIYPLYVMQKYRAEVIEPRWVYMLTEGQPAARAVDFRVTYDGARKRALKIFDEGAALIAKINDRADPNSLTANPAACDMYHRKCIYHHSVGGPCQAESSPGKMARAFLARGPKQERTIMAFKRVLETAQAGSNESAAGAEQNESATEPGEGAVEQTEEQKAAASKRTYNKKPKAPVAGAGGITVTFHDGFALELPEASPIAAKLTAIHTAMFGE